MEWLFKELVEKFKVDMNIAILAAGYAPVGSFQKGAEVKRYNETVLWKLPDGDGEYYRWDGDLPKLVPENSTPSTTGGIKTTDNPDGLWVSVGDASLRNDVMNGNGELLGLSYNATQINFDANKYVQLQVFADLFIEKYPRVIDGIHAACDYVASKGGGYVFLSAKTYLIEDELVCRDNVIIKGVGHGQWEGVTTIKWNGGNGDGKCVIRGSKSTLGVLSDSPLNSSGATDLFVDAEGCDAGLYSCHAINGSIFSNIKTRNATKINTYIIRSWYCDYTCLTSVRSKGLGVVIGKAQFGEDGDVSVNACEFGVLSSHSSGFGSSIVDEKGGVGVTIGKGFNSNNINVMHVEKNEGVGLVTDLSFPSSINSIYAEGNGIQLDGDLKNCSILNVMNGNSSRLSINSLYLAKNQTIANNEDLGLVITTLERQDNNVTFTGTGRVIISASNLLAFTLVDWSKVACDVDVIATYVNVDMQNTAAVNKNSFFNFSTVNHINIILVPNETKALSAPLSLGIDGTNRNFGTSFVKDEPIIMRVGNFGTGRHRLTVLGTPPDKPISFDVIVAVSRTRSGGFTVPSLALRNSGN